MVAQSVMVVAQKNGDWVPDCKCSGPGFETLAFYKLGLDALSSDIEAGKTNERLHGQAVVGWWSEMMYCEISKEMSSLYFDILFYSAYLRLESQNLTCNPYRLLPPPPPDSCDCSVLTLCWDLSFELAEYIKSKIQQDNDNISLLI